MRIIAGKARGRELRAPRGLKTRPTTDRVREALFSIIEARLDLEGARVLDLFAGSGALALEALSRGAARAICVDRAPACREAIGDNAERLDMGSELEILVLDVERALPRLASRQERFELVLLDPPYALSPWSTVEQLLELELLTPDALVVVEHAARTEAPTAVVGGSQGRPTLEVIKQRCYGDTALALYALGDEPQ